MFKLISFSFCAFVFAAEQNIEMFPENWINSSEEFFSHIVWASSYCDTRVESKKVKWRTQGSDICLSFLYPPPWVHYIDTKLLGNIRV